jgi:hypothetical protein
MVFYCQKTIPPMLRMKPSKKFFSHPRFIFYFFPTPHKFEAWTTKGGRLLIITHMD